METGQDLFRFCADQCHAGFIDAIQAFFDVLIAQERVKVAEESLRIATNGADAVGRRVTAGKVSPTEETRARVAQSTARIEQRLAQADLTAALKALSVVMGVPQGSISLVDGSPDALPVLPGAETLGDRIQSSPILRRAQMEVQRAEAAFNLERARGVPDVTVGLGAQRAPDIGRTQPLISVSIPIPLFDRNQGAQFQALRKREAAQALAQAEEQRLRTEVLQAVDQLEARADEVEALRRDVLPGAQTAYDAARRGFELGKFSFLDVLDAQGNVVASNLYGPQGIGDVPFAWGGMDSAGKQVPAGNYTFKATVMNKGNSSTTPVSVYATVNSVSQANDKSIMLNVTGGKSIKLTDLTRIGG